MAPVRKSGDRVRINAQLIHARDGSHIWSETYDRELRDVFEIQSDVALHIADALEAEITPAERAGLARQPTESVEAHTLYLKGASHAQRPASFSGAWRPAAVRSS